MTLLSRAADNLWLIRQCANLKTALAMKHSPAARVKPAGFMVFGRGDMFRGLASAVRHDALRTFGLIH